MPKYWKSIMGFIIHMILTLWRIRQALRPTKKVPRCSNVPRVAALHERMQNLDDSIAGGRARWRHGSAALGLLTGLSRTCSRSPPACWSPPSACCAADALSPCATALVIGELRKAAEGGRRKEQQSISFLGATSRTVCASTSVAMHAQGTQHRRRSTPTASPRHQHGMHHQSRAPRARSQRRGCPG